MEQEHKFFMTEQERVDGLTNLLIKTLEKEGVNLEPCGGFRTTIGKKLDFSSYDLFSDKIQIGHYEFELKQKRYHCILDLQGLPKDNYKRIKEIVEKEFLEIKSN